MKELDINYFLKKKINTINTKIKIKLAAFLLNFGIEKDKTKLIEKAVRLYEEAAKEGNPDAQNELGGLYYEGKGVEQSFKKAAEWFIVAANQQFTLSEYNLGTMYESGIGVPKCIEKAVELYEKAAKKGSPEAQNSLGILYYKGYGVKQNFEKAVLWLKKAAMQNFSTAQVNLGSLYKSGKGVEQNYEIAVEWLKKAAKQENPEAEAALGEAYLYGKGVEQNYEVAAYWLKKASEHGDASAQNFLGYLYENVLGVQQSYIKALESYNKIETKSGKKHYCSTIITKLKGKEVGTIKNIAECLDKEIDEYGAIRISPEENSELTNNILYSIEDFKKIKQVINKLLEDVDQREDNGNNELKIFMQVYVKLAKLISYDYEAYNSDKSVSDLLIKDPSKYYTSRNLIGGLLQGKSICSGYAEILRNVLACRSIECRYISGEGHVYNQVKINGKWYYIDLTFDSEQVVKGEKLKWCLKGERNFKQGFSDIHTNLPNMIADKAEEDFPEDKIDKVYKETLKQYEENSSFELLLREISNSDFIIRTSKEEAMDREIRREKAYLAQRIISGLEQRIRSVLNDEQKTKNVGE